MVKKNHKRETELLIMTAKQETTRLSRLEGAIKASAEARRLI